MSEMLNNLIIMFLTLLSTVGLIIFYYGILLPKQIEKQKKLDRKLLEDSTNQMIEN